MFKVLAVAVGTLSLAVRSVESNAFNVASSIECVPYLFDFAEKDGGSVEEWKCMLSSHDEPDHHAGVWYSMVNFDNFILENEIVSGYNISTFYEVGVIENDPDDGPSLVFLGMTTYSIESTQEERQLNTVSSYYYVGSPLPKTGDHTMLIILATSNDTVTKPTQEQLESHWWDPAFNGPPAQFSKCSDGQLTFSPASGANITNGIVTIDYGEPMSGKNKLYGLNQAVILAEEQVGPMNQWTNVGVVLPRELNWGSTIGFAPLNAAIASFKNSFGKILFLNMHEMGHNLGLDHSGYNGYAAGDSSGYMSSPDTNKYNNYAQCCFSAPQSWGLGWYSDYHAEIDMINTKSWSGKLSTISDFVNDTLPASSSMILRIINNDINNDDVYVMYNRQKAPNQHAILAGDMVTVHQISVFHTSWESNLDAILDAGQKYTYTGFQGGYDLVVEVCDKTLGESGDYAYIIAYEDNGVDNLSCPCVDDAACDDGNACTIDTCINASCQYEDVVCDNVFKESCEIDFCNVTTGCEVIPDPNCSQPTHSPSISLDPSVLPSSQPSGSLDPSVLPSLAPSTSSNPSQAPSVLLSLSPSESLDPSIMPSLTPSTSQNPSKAPTAIPSSSPSESLDPSILPTNQPSGSLDPSILGSSAPSISFSPTEAPSEPPSSMPSLDPSTLPSLSPSSSPSPGPDAECVLDSDCTDSSVCTDDICANGVCVNEQLQAKPSSCGNGVCEYDENCQSCSDDCNGKTGSRAYCCYGGANVPNLTDGYSNPVDCSNSECLRAGLFCDATDYSSCTFGSAPTEAPSSTPSTTPSQSTGQLTPAPSASTSASPSASSGCVGNADCYDGDVCTSDVCDNGTCIFQAWAGPPPECGNGVCEEGEDCYECSDDCASSTKGKNQFCCYGGEITPSVPNAVDCNYDKCTSGGSQCDLTSYLSCSTI